MHKWYSFKCETDRRRTRFLWWWHIGFGSFHNKIFILLSSRAFYSRKIKWRSPGNLLAHCSLFCQEVKCESRRAQVNMLDFTGVTFTRDETNCTQVEARVFQSGVMLSGAYGRTHPSSAPWIPQVLNADVLPHFILCILTWFSHIYGLCYYQPVKLTEDFVAEESSGEGQQSLFHLKGWNM